jgi:hypothetical protein
MVGTIVHGDNHFIVRGPLPDRDAARALFDTGPSFRLERQHRRCSRDGASARRSSEKTLEWAVIVAGNREISPAEYRLTLVLLHAPRCGVFSLSASAFCQHRNGKELPHRTPRPERLAALSGKWTGPGECQTVFLGYSRGRKDTHPEPLMVDRSR